MWNEWHIVKYMCFLVIQLPPAIHHIHHISPAIHPFIGVICPSLSASSSASCCLSRSKAARSNSRSASRSASRSSSFAARKFPGGESTSSCRVLKETNLVARTNQQVVLMSIYIYYIYYICICNTYVYIHIIICVYIYMIIIYTWILLIVEISTPKPKSNTVISTPERVFFTPERLRTVLNAFFHAFWTRFSTPERPTSTLKIDLLLGLESKQISIGKFQVYIYI